MNKNIAIVGGRDFDNYQLLKDNLIDYCFATEYEGGSDGEWSPVYYSVFKDVIIVSGGAKGADKLGERFADEFRFKKLIFKPDWELFGKRAGFMRNEKIIQNADVVFAFWDGKSKGTAHSISLAEDYGKELYIIKYGEKNNEEN